MKNRFPNGIYSDRFFGYNFVGRTIMQIKAILLLMVVVAFVWIVPAQAKEEIDFRYALAGIGDVNGDAVPDIAVGAPTHGQVVVFSGTDGTLLYTLDAPDPQEQADFGHRLAGVEDVNGDAVPDIAVGALTRGQVVVFSGADGTLLSNPKSPESHAETVFGKVSPLPGLGRVGGDTVIEDVNGDAVSDIAVEDPSHGRVLMFSGADGSLLHTLEFPGQRAAADTRVPRTQEQALASICVARTKYVQAGDWRTLEWFWNASGTAYFLHPAGARIKVRYGVGWFGFDRQKQTLDGINTKTLSVGGGSIARARMQMKVTQSVHVNYSVCV